MIKASHKDLKQINTNATNNHMFYYNIHIYNKTMYNTFYRDIITIHLRAAGTLSLSLSLFLHIYIYTHTPDRRHVCACIFVYLSFSLSLSLSIHIYI